MRCGGKPRPVGLTRIGGSGRLRDLRLNSLVLKNAQRETPPAVSDPPAGFGPCISIRSHCRPNSDTGLCEVKARGEIRVPHSLLLSPRLAQDWRGFFVTPAASFLRMPSWRPRGSVAGAPARRCALEDEGVLLNRSVRSGSSLVATDQRPDLMIVNDALRGKRVMYKRLATGVFRDVGNSYRRRR